MEPLVQGAASAVETPGHAVHVVLATVSKKFLAQPVVFAVAAVRMPVVVQL